MKNSCLLRYRHLIGRLLVCALPLLNLSWAMAASPMVPSTDTSHPGYRFLVDTPLIPPDFDQETIERVWEAWPEPLRLAAANATPTERRSMIFSRYGLTPRTDEPDKPLQYVVDAQGNWTMNCFACHGGAVAGATVPGAPNNEFDLQTLTEETRLVKLRMGKPLARMDLGSVFVPLGTTRGTTNAVMFGVGLMHFRDSQLNVVQPQGRPAMQHHDMDAPAWWNYHLRSHIYIDGFAQRSHRSLMQFALVRENGPDWFKDFESKFKVVDEYLFSLRPPPNPYPIDFERAGRGRLVFKNHCAECHGTYADTVDYPSRNISLGDVGTDPVRLKALTAANREGYHQGWFGSFGKESTVTDPKGYVAPPLTGIWATAPYLHNGSVPTLWHLLHPEERPKIWKRQSGAYDAVRVGITVTEVDRIPTSERDISERRKYFDTQVLGKSAAGHSYPSRLTEQEKTWVLEYLKTL